MESKVLIEMIFGIIGGLGIFLLGMKNMSEGMQAVAGNNLRKLISAVTNNRFLACGVGTMVTMIIQSSSVTTVIVVGMVNASIMTLQQAIGVILGANIGTTITAWILVLKIGKYGLPMVGVAAFFYLFTKRDRIRYIAMVLMGLGMVFFGLELMKKGFSPLREMQAFIDWFSKFEPDTYLGVWKCVLVGAMLTAIVQSSSATIGITMALAAEGIISYPTAAALVLGENIGTTITAFLASIGTGRNARRAAYAHMIINILGVVWITAIFFFYINLVKSYVGVDPAQAVTDAAGEVSYPNTKACIATTHTCFNVVNALVFLPFIGLLCKILYKIVPDKGAEKAHLTYLDIRMLDAPAIGMEQAEKEVFKMGDSVYGMLEPLKTCLSSDKRNKENEEFIFTQERNIDLVQMEVVNFIGDVMKGNVPDEIIEQGRHQLRIADEYESISDYITNILKLRLKMSDTEQEMTGEGKEELLDLHDKVAEYIKMIINAVKAGNGKILAEAQAKGQTITKTMKKYRSNHLNRVESGQATAIKSLIYTDMLNAYRRIKDHGLNIADVLAGEK